MAVPVKNQAFDFYVTLGDSLDPDTFKINPTIAAGDFMISKDGGAFTNLTTLPVVTPAGSRLVKVSLNATEMDADSVNIQAVDQSGAEWQDIMVAIDVPETSTDILGDLAFGDRIESSTRLIINKAGTLDPVLDKEIEGSLLSPSVTIRTTDT